MGPRIFRLLLQMFPRGFRSQFGAGILDVLNQGYIRARARGRTHGLVFIVRAVVNLIGSGVRERFRPSAGERPPNRSPRIIWWAWWRDFRIAVRTWIHQPTLATIVVMTLALGIGASTAVFTVLHSVVLAPLPYAAPDRLMRVQLFRPDAAPENRVREFLSPPFIHELENQNGVFSDLAAMYTYRDEGADLTGGDRPTRLRLFPVSANYFDVLGVQPAVGVGFHADEQGSQVAILSHSLWVQAFGSDLDITNRSILLDGVPHRVAGVMPPGFLNPMGHAADVWTLLDLRIRDWQAWEWENHYLGSIARLAPDVTIESAQERLNAFSRALVEQTPVSYELGARLDPLYDAAVGAAGSTLWMLMGAVALLLFTACVNIANLILVHNTSRSHQLALRVALGAGRVDIFKGLIAESLVLCSLGGVIGVILAVVGVKGLLLLSPDHLPRSGEIAPGLEVVVFATVIAVGTGVVFGLTPLWTVKASRLTQALRQGFVRGSQGLERTKFQSSLVVLQTTVSVVLLITAGLLAKSFLALRNVDLGVEPSGVLMFEVHLPDTRYDDPTTRIAFHQNFYERLHNLPEITDVGSVDWLPAHNTYHPWGFQRLDVLEGSTGELRQDADVRVVAGRYFDVAGLTLFRGRLISTGDDVDSPKVAVVSQAVARQSYPNGDVLGKRINILGRVWEIVGVVEDVPNDPRGNVTPIVYLPHDQFADNRNWQLYHMVSTPLAPVEIIPRVRELLREMDPELVLYRARPFENALSEVVAVERFVTILMMLFASIAFVLAIVGIYGVVSYIANSRRHEIGIRLVLGAEGGDVRRLVTRRALQLSGVGIVLGVLAAMGLTRLLRSMIFSVQVADVTVFATVVVTFMAAAWVAGIIPALRATRTEPVSVLRDDSGE